MFRKFESTTEMTLRSTSSGWITSKSGCSSQPFSQSLSRLASSMCSIYKLHPLLVPSQSSCHFGEPFSLWAGDAILGVLMSNGMIMSFKTTPKTCERSSKVNLASTQLQICLTPTSQETSFSLGMPSPSSFASLAGLCAAGSLSASLMQRVWLDLTIMAAFSTCLISRRWQMRAKSLTLKAMPTWSYQLLKPSWRS